MGRLQINGHRNRLKKLNLWTEENEKDALVNPLAARYKTFAQMKARERKKERLADVWPGVLVRPDGKILMVKKQWTFPLMKVFLVFLGLVLVVMGKRMFASVWNGKAVVSWIRESVLGSGKSGYEAVGDGRATLKAKYSLFKSYHE